MQQQLLKEEAFEIGSLQEAPDKLQLKLVQSRTAYTRTASQQELSQEQADPESACSP